MKTLFFIFSLVTLVSCSKQGVYYKYAYLDTRNVEVVTTHLIEVDHTLSTSEINTRLSEYRAMKNKYVLVDTIVPMGASTQFLVGGN